MATQLKCPNCGDWNSSEDSCSACGTPRRVHSTFANQKNPERFKAFEMPVMEWNHDPSLPRRRRALINTGKALHWAVLTVGGVFAWMAYWVAV
ncbi:MAG: hypothetical protein ACO30N_01505 [Schleiferiaceae bacterium]